MEITKKNVKQILRSIISPGSEKDIVSAGVVKNIQVFGDQVDIDLVLNNPSLQARKKLEVEILKIIHSRINVKAKVEIKIEVVINKSSIENSIKANPIPGIHSIIAIASGKGGVGKSTVTANLAVTLSQMGLKVGILDADIYGPSMPLMFDLEGEKPLAQEVNGKSKMKPLENYGVKILSIGFFTGPDQAVIWRGPMATKALKQLIFDSAWGELDFLLVDLPPGTGDIHLSIVQSIPLTGAVIVSTPQQIALADARKGISMFQQESINVPVLGIVENMAYFIPEELPNSKYYIFGKDGGKILSESKKIPFLGSLPLVQSIREASDFGRPAGLQEKGVIRDSFIKVAQEMTHQVLKRNKNLPPTKAVEITTMTGCSEVK
ncbi:MAG: chromosome partitioning protein [Flavobacteriaceae bacterium]|nr:chromosome partitioning protein [Flavobacteriaceae bacterium]|tara:strand:- start:39780 stop:40913 length:1134 start_codon:yes stop_codon:yes gene_type:complete